MRKRIGTYIKKVCIKNGPAYISQLRSKTINLTNDNPNAKYFAEIPAYTLQPTQRIHTLCGEVTLDFLHKDQDSGEFVDIGLRLTTADLSVIEVRQFLVQDVWNQISGNYTKEGFVLADLVY